MKLNLYPLCMLLTAALMLSACSLLEKIEQSPMTSQLVTNQITLRFIAGADDPVQRAENVRDVIQDVSERLQGSEAVTLESLDQYVRSQIDWQRYSLADQELINFGLTKARAAIADLIGEGVVDPDERHTVSTLLRWIDQAAQRVQ